MWIDSERHGTYLSDRQAILDAEDLVVDMWLRNTECLIVGDIQRDKTARFLVATLHKKNDSE